MSAYLKYHVVLVPDQISDLVLDVNPRQWRELVRDLRLVLVGVSKLLEGLPDP